MSRSVESVGNAWSNLHPGRQPLSAIESPENKNTAGSARISAQRSDALDGLRGLAIAMVLWLHCVQQFLPPGRGSWLGWLRAGTGLSWAGVDLFFALSGFLIGGILIDQRDSPRMVRVFYLRRAARILPLYYLTLVAIAVLLLARLPGSYHLFPGWVYGLFLTNFAFGFANHWDWLPLSVLWTIAVEEQFYLTAPWVVRAIPRSFIPWLAAGLVALAEAARAGMLLVYPHGNFALAVLTPFRMDALAMGVLAAWAARAEAAAAFLSGLGAHWRRWLALGLSLVAALDLVQPKEGSRALALFGYLLLAAVFSLTVIIVASLRPPGLNRFLEWRPLVHLGRHSYFIYLWHGLVAAVVIRGLAGPDFTLNTFGGAGLVALAVAVTWGAATASWRWFEAPIVAWGHRHSY